MFHDWEKIEEKIEEKMIDDGCLPNMCMNMSHDNISSNTSSAVVSTIEDRNDYSSLQWEWGRDDDHFLIFSGTIFQKMNEHQTTHQTQLYQQSIYSKMVIPTTLWKTCSLDSNKLHCMYEYV